MATQKIQPLDKTVVTEFNIHVADIHMRIKQMNGSQAARVARDGSFAQGDFNADSEIPFTLVDVKRVIAIQSWQPLKITLVKDEQSMEFPCSGLFITYGAFDSVSIRAASPGDPVRVTYIAA